MESEVMKIKRLKINKLHGHINYDVKFNENITFLYGDNGCGKTTLLNIITYIITGQIYKLFSLYFDEIVLTYKAENTTKNQSISIKRIDDNIKIDFSSETAILEQRIEYTSRASDEFEDINHTFFTKYPILEKIKNTFNYVYLPLNRNSSLSIDDPFIFRGKKMAKIRYNRVKGKYDSSNVERTLFEVEALVSLAFNKANSTLSHINEEFSDSILKSFLDIEDIMNTDKVLKYMMSLNTSKIEEMKSAYITVLKTLDKLDDISIKKVNAFFESLKNDISISKKNNNTINIEYLFKLSEVSKISDIIDKAEEAEKAKKEAKRSIETFLNTVNKFVKNDITNKEIYIDEDGVVYLKTNVGKPIGIQNMSSGEKQIVTFFAYLIFGLESTNQSIFIVDEPELSLHLKWQKQFVDSIIDVNSNVQLIFATHAPEMIGRHRDKAVKLVPEV